MKYYIIKFIIFVAIVTPSLIAMRDEKPGDIVYDDYSKQWGKVIELDQKCLAPNQFYGQKMLALVPLPGETVPCDMRLDSHQTRAIDNEDAQRVCTTYCATYPELHQLFQQLRAGNPIRTLISGQSGTGKNHISHVFTQECDHPYSVFDIPIVFLGSKWSESRFHGMTSILQQAKEYARITNRKVIAILDNVEIIDRASGISYQGQPETPGSTAIHNFFDQQDRGDELARMISIIALTSRPHLLRSRLKERFYQQITLQLPAEVERYSALQNHFKKYPDVGYLHDLARITEHFNHFHLSHIRPNAQIRDGLDWPSVQQACQQIRIDHGIATPPAQRSSFSSLFTTKKLLALGAATIGIGAYLYYLRAFRR